MAQTNLLKLNRVQNIILGTTKDTPIETMRFMLDLPPTQTRQKVEYFKAYFSAVENDHNPLHEHAAYHCTNYDVTDQNQAPTRSVLTADTKITTQQAKD